MADSVVETATRFHTYGSPDKPIRLERGGTLPEVTLAYQTWGELSPERDNAVLVFHALTGSQNASGFNPTVPGVEHLWTDECQQGWWSGWIGPGLAIDTNRLFVICANYLGGCYGSTGPSSINPQTGRRYGGSFPIVTVGDIVDSQVHLLEHLGIRRLLAVVGASLGGMLAIDFCVRYPTHVRGCIPIATGTRSTTLTKVMNFEQIFAIEEDEHFNRGDYYDGPPPIKGMQLARMIAHKTFVSLDFMDLRASMQTRQASDDLKGYQLNSALESYMLHQGKKFVKRFDANTYLRLLTAWQIFELQKTAPDGKLATALKPCRDIEFTIFSIDVDVCFWPEEQAELEAALKEVGAKVVYVTLHSEKGHDSFLLEPEIFRPHVEYKLNHLMTSAAAARNGRGSKEPSWVI